MVEDELRKHTVVGMIDKKLDRPQPMNLQEIVLQFHLEKELSVGVPLDQEQDLRLRLIDEEFEELKVALQNHDEVEVADAIGDLLYVVMGCAVTWGIPMEAVVKEIHRSNLTKDGTMSTGGKLLKGEGFEEPELQKVMAGARSDWYRCPKCCMETLSMGTDEMDSEDPLCGLCGWTA